MNHTIKSTMYAATMDKEVIAVGSAKDMRRIVKAGNRRTSRAWRVFVTPNTKIGSILK